MPSAHVGGLAASKNGRWRSTRVGNTSDQHALYGHQHSLTLHVHIMRRLTLLPTLMEADEEFGEKMPLTEASLLMLALVNSGKAIRRASEQLLLPTHRPSFVTARSRVVPLVLGCILLLFLEVGLRLR